MCLNLQALSILVPIVLLYFKEIPTLMIKHHNVTHGIDSSTCSPLILHNLLHEYVFIFFYNFYLKQRVFVDSKKWLLFLMAALR